jgi:uncharacterized damage-inducible protein DinB
MPEKNEAAEAILSGFAANENANQMLIDAVPDEVWALKPPSGKGRTIAAIAAHMHNVRLMWLESAKWPNVPAKAEKETLTRNEASSLLEESYEAIVAAVSDRLPLGKFPGFGSHATAFISYLIAHDAHHRGQICMQSRLLGHALPKSLTFGMWEWGKMSRAASG